MLMRLSSTVRAKSLPIVRSCQSAEWRSFGSGDSFWTAKHAAESADEKWRRSQLSGQRDHRFLWLSFVCTIGFGWDGGQKAVIDQRIWQSGLLVPASLGERTLLDHGAGRDEQRLPLALVA